MYTHYFELTELPFSISPDPRYLFMSPRHREALEHLINGVRESGGFVLLTGDVGTGKTTLLRCLLAQQPEHVNIALILNPRLNAVELLATICDELRIEYPAGTDSLKVLVDALMKYLLAAHAQELRTVLIIDEAQNLSFEVLEQVRLLSNLETTRSKLLQIILVGHPELNHILQHKDLSQVSQRITCRYHLVSFATVRLTADYIRHRISISGGHTSKLFTRAAIRKIHRVSGGVPRLINLICHRALHDAFRKRKKIVGARLVRRAISEVRPVLARPWFRKAVYWAPALAAVFVIGIVAGYYVNHFGLPRFDRTPSVNKLIVPAGNETLDRTLAQKTNSGILTDKTNPSSVPATESLSKPATTVTVDVVSPSIDSATNSTSDPSATTTGDVVKRPITSATDSASEPLAETTVDMMTPPIAIAVDTAGKPLATDTAEVVRQPIASAKDSAGDPSATTIVDMITPPITTATDTAVKPSTTATAEVVKQPITSAKDSESELLATATPDAVKQSITSTADSAGESLSIATTDEVNKYIAPKTENERLTTLNSAATPKASKDSADHPGFAELIRDPKLTQDEAFARLFSQWNIGDKAEWSAQDCTWVLEKGLHCLFEESNWHFMRRLNRPAILEFLMKNSQKRYATLVALDEHRLTLDLGAQRLTFPLEEVLPFWRGRYILLWKPLYQNMSLLHPGSNSTMVRRLRQQIAEIGMPVSAAAGDSSVYDEELKRQVIAFQISRGIRPDGIVGPHTMIHLNTVANTPEVPMLERGGKKVELTADHQTEKP